MKDSWGHCPWQTTKPKIVGEKKEKVFDVFGDLASFAMRVRTDNTRLSANLVRNGTGLWANNEFQSKWKVLH